MIEIVGAGMAGLLAANILRKEAFAIYERSTSLPNNHSAVLRFRSELVSEAVNIPFKKVKAIKSVAPYKNAIADAMNYSLKTNGTATLRSVLSASNEAVERYIAPSDFIARMAASVDCPINYGHIFEFKRSDAVISTIPMPALMHALGWDGPEPEYKYRSGANITATILGADAYCSLYIPDPMIPFSRISLTGNRLSAECYRDSAYEDFLGREGELVKQAMSLLGILGLPADDVKVSRQKYGKILPIDERARREFIMWASEQWGVYSLGRFATWRPHLLLDDVVNDVRVIQRLISNQSESYAHKLRG